MARKLLRSFSEMAKISVARAEGSYRITVEGQLEATDLKRLERACRFALEQRVLPLEINLEAMNTIDEAARAYLDRLRARGARLYGDRELPHVGGRE
jgi:hypothetical protein